MGREIRFLLGWVLFFVHCVDLFRLPEPKGRTYGEMDVLFERGISAREFKDTKLNIFRGDHVKPVEEKDAISEVEVYVKKA